MSGDEGVAFRIENSDVDDEFDLDVPPTSGSEYLRRVQMQAKNIPHVMLSGIDTTKLNKNQNVGANAYCGIQKAPKGYAPSLEWQKKQVADFSETRQQLAKYKSAIVKEKLKPSVRLPLREDVNKWCKLCFGRLAPPNFPVNAPGEDSEDSKDSTENYRPTVYMPPSPAAPPSPGMPPSPATPAGSECVADDTTEKSPPLLSIIGHMSQPMVISVLEYHVNWFEATGFSEHQGRWLYSLLACTEKPLDPEACALLRTLARNCANLRASLEGASHPHVAALNLLICLVGRYFEQNDMVDHT